jgi:16S rRNA U1498 N3-methylase RsmE
VRLFGSYGLPPVTLGSQVLRVETACVSMTAVLKYELERPVPGQ